MQLISNDTNDLEMKAKDIFIALSLILSMASCSSDGPKDPSDEPGEETPGIVDSRSVAETNTLRAIKIINSAVDHYFEGSSMQMARYYNPFTGIRSNEIGSVWMYTSSIEAVNATMKAMKDLKDNGKPELYNQNWTSLQSLLERLVDNLEYYAGTFDLTSYTGTNSWTVYAVNRAGSPGSADVTGVLNVYDDQEWLVGELLESYSLTGNQKYLNKAEYLAAYVLDGWDCTLDADGNENGGITWGPGYTTKHSCSNGPMITPLVELSNLYKGKSDEISYNIVEPDKSRKKMTAPKSEYYLMMAKKIYDWQKRKLFNQEKGVYWDMLGADGGVSYETIGEERYRMNNRDTGAVGNFYSYNTGTMLSGAAALTKAGVEGIYADDVKSLTTSSFNYFAKLGSSLKGYYSFDLTGFSPWFNCVLMKSYAAAYPLTSNAEEGLKAFQTNLDYGYSNFLEQDMIPVNPLSGWNRDRQKCDTEAMFTFATATEYAVLASHEISKK